MELEFDITQSFEEDLNHLPLEQRGRIMDQVNIIAYSFMGNKSAFEEQSSIPYIFNLKGGLDSSLYLIKADNKLRIAAAIDEDPIFDKIRFTLFRLIDNSKAERVYREVGEEIYRKSGILI